MGQSKSKNSARNIVNDTSNGSHFIELHFPSVGASLTIVLVIILVFIGVIYLARKACSQQSHQHIPPQNLIPLQPIESPTQPFFPPFYGQYPPPTYPQLPSAPALNHAPIKLTITKEVLQDALKGLPSLYQQVSSHLGEETMVNIAITAFQAKSLGAKPAIVKELDTPKVSYENKNEVVGNLKFDPSMWKIHQKARRPESISKDNGSYYAKRMEEVPILSTSADSQQSTFWKPVRDPNNVPSQVQKLKKTLGISTE